MSKSFRFQANTLIVGGSTKIVKFDIPQYFQDGDHKFLITSVLGKMGTTTSPVFIHSRALRNQGVAYEFDGGNDLIETTVLTNVASNPINVNTQTTDRGFIFPAHLTFDCTLDFTVTDHLGAPLTDLEYILITLEVF